MVISCKQLINYQARYIMGRVNVKVRDFSDEYSNVGLNIADAADLDAWSIPNGLSDAFASHIQAMSIGTVATVKYSQETQPEDDTRPASSWAQRELGIRVYLKDTVNGKLGTLTVPAADLATVPTIAGTDLVDPGQAPYSTFVTWLEANALSDAGNPITVERSLVVGRNS